MAEKTSSNTYEPKEVIIRENTKGDCAYIILAGMVEISKRIEGQRVVLDRLGPGRIFGEMALIDDSPRSATVTAIESTRLSIIDRYRFNKILQLIPEEVRPIFTAISERLRRTNEMVSALSQPNRYYYSICSILCMLAHCRGEQKGESFVCKYHDLVLEICRVLALVPERVENATANLARTGLLEIDRSGGSPDQDLLTVKNLSQFHAFLEFMSERLGDIPGLPRQPKKYFLLSPKAEEILFNLKNKAGRLPLDKEDFVHYDYDDYVKDSVDRLGYSVKDTILRLQELAANRVLQIRKFSELVQNKAIVYQVQELSRVEMMQVQAHEFDKFYKIMLSGKR